MSLLVRSAFDRGASDDHGAMSVTPGVHNGPEKDHLEVGAPLALTRASKKKLLKYPEFPSFHVTEAQGEVGQRLLK